MTKFTKKQFEKEQKEILSQIEKLQNVLEALPLETEGIPQNIISLIGDTWNTTHDEIEELKKELNYLDQNWSRRNWTQQEYNEWELISNNID